MFPEKSITILSLALFLLLIIRTHGLAFPHYSFLPFSFAQTKDTEVMDSTDDCFRNMYL
jgi:hypothetical protein